MILFGAMNNPSKDPKDEILSVAMDGFDFCDFTYEAKAKITPQRALQIRRELGVEFGNPNIAFVGHTAYYIPYALDFPEVAQASVEAFQRSIHVLSFLGAKKITIHHDPGSGFISTAERIKHHIKMLKELSEYLKNSKIKIMLENSPFGHNQAFEFKRILEAVPEVGLHIDFAHALITGGMKEVVNFLKLGENGRLIHTHFSDNNGSKDEHQPILVPHKVKHSWQEIIKDLKATGYGGEGRYDTITLEVFSDDHWNRIHSRELIRAMWENA